MFLREPNLPVQWVDLIAWPNLQQHDDTKPDAQYPQPKQEDDLEGPWDEGGDR